MLAGLAAQTFTVESAQTISAYATTIVVFAALLVAASIVVSTVRPATLQSVRMTGPAVKRWSGFVLLAVGGWFVLLAVLPSPLTRVLTFE